MTHQTAWQAIVHCGASGSAIAADTRHTAWLEVFQLLSPLSKIARILVGCNRDHTQVLMNPNLSHNRCHMQPSGGLWLTRRRHLHPTLLNRFHNQVDVEVNLTVPARFHITNFEYIEHMAFVTA